MPYPVRNLLENKNEPVVAQLSFSVRDVLGLMLENDYSQLPVVDQQNTPIGFVTFRGITRTLLYLECPIEELVVETVYEKVDKAQVYRGDDDLFDLLDRLRDNSVILVVDSDNRLIGVVTTYDATEYLRMRSEDMMFVADIEATLKDLILTAFTDARGEVNQQNLKAAIEKISTSNQPTKADFAKALSKYLELSQSGKFESVLMLRAYEEHIQKPTKIPEFDELTLYSYIELLLHPDQNDFFQAVFSYTQNQIRKLFQGVRETRNALAHFREINSAQRDQLRYCKDMLEKITGALPEKENTVVGADTKETEPAVSQEDALQIVPMDEEVSPTESKYASLIDKLQKTNPDHDQVKLTFDEINDVLNGGLPPSARIHRAWWANDSIGHVQSQLWLAAGWKTTYINITEETVVFSRIKEVERRYINFYNNVQTKLSKTGVPMKKNISAQGNNWITIYQIPDPGPASAILGFSFTKEKKFRVEFYIDCGNKDKNKMIFDLLHQEQAKLQSAITEPMTWERIDKKRASRVAIYHPGHISDSDEELDKLSTWAVEAMKQLSGAIVEPAQLAIKQVMGI